MVEFYKVVDELEVFLVMNGLSIYLGNVDRNGFLPSPIRNRLTPETLKTIATKTKEVREFGIYPEPCTECIGTPYFPLNNCLSERHLEFY